MSTYIIKPVKLGIVLRGNTIRSIKHEPCPEMWGECKRRYHVLLLLHCFPVNVFSTQRIFPYLFSKLQAVVAVEKFYVHLISPPYEPKDLRFNSSCIMIIGTVSKRGIYIMCSIYANDILYDNRNSLKSILQP